MLPINAVDMWKYKHYTTKWRGGTATLYHVKFKQTLYPKKTVGVITHSKNVDVVHSTSRFEFCLCTYHHRKCIPSSPFWTQWSTTYIAVDKFFFTAYTCIRIFPDLRCRTGFLWRPVWCPPHQVLGSVEFSQLLHLDLDTREKERESIIQVICSRNIEGKDIISLFRENKASKRSDHNWKLLHW